MYINTVFSTYFSRKTTQIKLQGALSARTCRTGQVVKEGAGGQGGTRAALACPSGPLLGMGAGQGRTQAGMCALLSQQKPQNLPNASATPRQPVTEVVAGNRRSPLPPRCSLLSLHTSCSATAGEGGLASPVPANDTELTLSCHKGHQGTALGQQEVRTGRSPIHPNNLRDQPVGLLKLASK